MCTFVTIMSQSYDLTGHTLGFAVDMQDILFARACMKMAVCTADLNGGLSEGQGGCCR